MAKRDEDSSTGPSLVVRVGALAYAYLRFEGTANRLREKFELFLCKGNGTSGSVATVHTIHVFDHEPEEPRRTDELEAAGDGFCFRLRFEHGGYAQASAYLWGELPAWQIATPLRQLLAWIVDAEGGVMLHAAGVRGRGLAVIGGPSGSGKSTLAAACAKQFQLLGDDWLPVWRAENGLWAATALYSSLKLSPDMSTRFGLDYLRSGYEHRGKCVLAYPPAIAEAYRIEAVVIPRVLAAKGLEFKIIPPFEAVKALAPSSLLQSAGVGDKALGRIVKLCQSVPCYELATSRETLDMARGIIRALKGY